MLGGLQSAVREPFVEAAQFVCSLMGPVPIGVMVLRSTGYCVAANATLEMLSRSVLDASSLSGTQIQLATAELNSAFSRALLGDNAMVETENPPVLGLGQGLWHIHFLPFVVENEHGVALLFEDMTEHRLTTEVFRAAEQRFRLLVDSASDGIVIFRAQILLYANAEAVKLFGFDSSDKLVGRPLTEMVDSDHRAEFEQLLHAIERDSGVGLFESMFLRNDGDAFPVECRTSRARVDDLGAGYVFFRDITERKRLQAKREYGRLAVALARMSSSAGRYLSNCASELQGVCNRIDAEPARVLESVEVLKKLANSLATQANVYRLSEPEVEPGTVSTLEELIARVCTNLQEATAASLRKDQLAGTNVTPDQRSSGLLVDLEPVQFPVRGDSNQIVLGLSTLALHVTKARAAQVPLCIRGAKIFAADSKQVMAYRLSIGAGTTRSVPTLAGATPYALDSGIYESWSRGQELELLGAFTLLQRQGCSVMVQDCPVGRYFFDIELGLDSARALDVELEAASDSPGAKSSSPQEPYDNAPDTERARTSGDHLALERAAAPVLICDDEARLVSLTAGLLREFGFEVLTVRSGAEAVRAVAEHPIDIVILDVNLPGEDALDIVAQLRSRSDVSIILSSGYTEEDIEPSLLQNESVKAFLAKPYGVEILVDTIDQVRNRDRTSSTLQNGLGL